MARELIMEISLSDTITAASESGYSGDGLLTIVSIAWAESGLDATARHTNGPTRSCPNGSIDRGILQINNCYWGVFSDETCDNPSSAFKASQAISKNGTSFTPWSTYNAGSYRQYVTRVQAAIQQQQIVVVGGEEADVTIQGDITLLKQYVARLVGATKLDTSGLPSLDLVTSTTYIVKQGDSLWAIASNEYNDGTKWQDIYNANKVTIGDNPNVLTVGMLLTVPKL